MFDLLEDALIGSAAGLITSQISDKKPVQSSVYGAVGGIVGSAITGGVGGAIVGGAIGSLLADDEDDE